MSNYKLMYLALFNVATDVITNLQNVQCETEELMSIHKYILEKRHIKFYLKLNLL